MYLGEIVGFSLSGYLCEHRIDWIDGYNIGSWPSVFVLFGCLGLLWFPCFIYFVHRCDIIIIIDIVFMLSSLLLCSKLYTEY